jgi:hypothetical protein
MAERITIHNDMEQRNRTRGRMSQYIKNAFPSAELDHYLETRYGTEYTFYPTHNADEPYACILNAYGGFTILTEF